MIKISTTLIKYIMRYAEIEIKENNRIKGLNFGIIS